MPRLSIDYAIAIVTFFNPVGYFEQSLFSKREREILCDVIVINLIFFVVYKNFLIYLHWIWLVLKRSLILIKLLKVTDSNAFSFHYVKEKTVSDFCSGISGSQFCKYNQ